jgi:CRISPR-associated protein Csx10
MSDRTTLDITITAKAPLALGDRKPTGRSSQAHAFIPGGLIRGALAERILAEKHGLAAVRESHGQCRDDTGSAAECDFCDLFLRDKTSGIFHNAYPLSENGECGVLPATARCCKTYGSDHDLFDMLIDRLCIEELGLRIPYAPTCPHCGERTESKSGLYSVSGPAGARKYLSSSEVPHRLLTRVGINRRRMTAEDELLYSFLVVPEGQTFQASVDVPSNLAADLKTLLIGVKHIGAGATRGLGAVEIRPSEHRAWRPDIYTRLQHFNAAYRERREQFQRLTGSTTRATSNVDEAWLYFTLGLRSEAILLDESGWQPTMVVSARALQSESECQAPLELVRSYASYGYRGGWNAAKGSLKDIDVVSSPGSTFVYRTPASSAADWTAALGDIERRGIGRRREEGFGHVSVCDEFHLAFRGNALPNEEKSK